MHEEVPLDFGENSKRCGLLVYREFAVKKGYEKVVLNRACQYCCYEFQEA